jgi:ATP-grasp domain, R2K clade family 3
MNVDPRLVWLVQENQDDRHAVAAVQDALDAMGVRWIGIDIDFRSASLPRVDSLKTGDRIICYGPSFITRIEHGDPRWAIGCIFNHTTFRWSAFRKHWGDQMLNANGQLVTVNELRHAPPTQRVFVRPDADSKTFDGGIRSPAELSALTEQLPGNLHLAIASVVPVDVEYRVFVVGGDVVGASEYRRNGKSSTTGFVPNDVIDLAIKADRAWHPADCYVMDIARSGNRFGIVEANCIMAARFYGANIRTIVQALCQHYGQQDDAT